MSILATRLNNSSRNIKFDDGYIEVAEFKNISLLGDNIEIDSNEFQDKSLIDRDLKLK